MIVNPFAGPGGWDVGLHALTGERALGFELDPDAVATRRAAGFLTIHADVSTVDLSRLPCPEGLIASPPCTAFSMAGKGRGRKWAPVLVNAIRGQNWGHRVLRRQDPTIWLPLEVGQWVDELRPEWIALEQVPPARALWDAYAEVFGLWGYDVWVGVLCAADFGVPQTRKRAVLLASRTREVRAPAPTHAEDGVGGLEPWVPVVAVLPELTGQAGWIASRPATTIAGDPRMWPPGHKVNAADRRRDPNADERYGNRAGSDAIRLTLEQALVLQSFPRDYPLVGTKTSRFRQVGNAVPPLLAQHVLSAVVSKVGP